MEAQDWWQELTLITLPPHSLRQSFTDPELANMTILTSEFALPLLPMAGITATHRVFMQILGLWSEVLVLTFVWQHFNYLADSQSPPSQASSQPPPPFPTSPFISVVYLVLMSKKTSHIVPSIPPPAPLGMEPRVRGLDMLDKNATSKSHSQP